MEKIAMSIEEDRAVEQAEQVLVPRHVLQAVAELADDYLYAYGDEVNADERLKTAADEWRPWHDATIAKWDPKRAKLIERARRRGRILAK